MSIDPLTSARDRAQTAPFPMAPAPGEHKATDIAVHIIYTVIGSVPSNRNRTLQTADKFGPWQEDVPEYIRRG